MRFGFTLEGVTASWSRDFRARYQDRAVDLDRCGRLLPIKGKTGVGKSTLLLLLAAMKRRDEGAITWHLPDARPCVLNSELNGIRRQYFGVMYQDARMLPHLSIADNLCYPLRLRGMGAEAARCKARATLQQFLIAGEDVDAILARYPDQLSGGQQRRAAIAKGVVWEPAVFFADEPSSNLDPDSRHQVMAALKGWATAPDTARALLWVTHQDTDLTHTGARCHLAMTAAEAAGGEIAIGLKVVESRNGGD